jgi:hypothetical protein
MTSKWIYAFIEFESEYYVRLGDFDLDSKTNIFYRERSVF